MNSSGTMDHEGIQSSPQRRGILPALVLLVALVALFLFDPNEHGFYPRCGFHALTGWDCPGCGGLRAAHQLLHGQVAAAWALNPLVPLLPVFGGIFVVIRRASPSSSGWLRRNWAAWVGIALLLFSLVRNLPGM